MRKASNLRSRTRQQCKRGLSEGLSKATTEVILKINSVKLLNPDTVTTVEAHTNGR